jgi:hypothetical protein
MNWKTFFILYLVLSSAFVYAQKSDEKIEYILDSRRYEAWTIEYERYRILLENAFDEYLSLTGEKLPPIDADDIIIAVRSKAGNRELYQIRYGTPIDGFFIIQGAKVGWILGTTLGQTIWDKDGYYNIDTSIPFEETSVQPELDYMTTQAFWPRTDLYLSLDRNLYRFSNAAGVLFEWGNERMGRPASTAGYMRAGIATPVFKIGVQMPSIIALENGYILRDTTTKALNGGFGGFGAFQYHQIYGEFAFLSNSGSMDIDPTVAKTGRSHINYSILSGLMYGTLGFSLGKNGGSMQIKPGFLVEGIAHRSLDNYDKLVNRYQMRNGDVLKLSESYYLGFFLRAEYVTNVTREGYPKFEMMGQLAGGTSVIGKLTYNVNKLIGIPVTLVYFLDNEADWNPNAGILVGLNFRLYNL